MAAPAIVLYTYSSCDTCRKAVKWLRARKIEFVEKPIRETPPSRAELRAMLGHQGGELKKIFNTSGQDYRALGLADKFDALSESEAIELLTTHGNLVKRPFLISPRVGLVGFNEAAWAMAFAAQ